MLTTVRGFSASHWLLLVAPDGRLRGTAVADGPGMNRNHVIAGLGCLLLTACAGEIDGDNDGAGSGETGGDVRVIDDPAVGVSVAVPAGWMVKKDEVLFDTHGFLLFAPAGDEEAEGDGEVAARIALAYRAGPDQLEELVASKMSEYAELDPRRVEVTLSDGRRGVAVTGLPGVRPYSVVYTADGERVYEIGLWSDEDGIDAQGQRLLEAIELRAPSRRVETLGLTAAADALYAEPPAEIAAANREAAAERRTQFELAAAEDPALMRAATEMIADPPLRGGEGSLAASCGFTAPASLYWQLQWDGTNRFYSGAWYNLRNQPGWSAMSGNYGSWWGTNFHIWKCHTGVLNQWFANDWPAQYWANAYAAFSGTVEWAGWGTDGFASLGRYVVVRNGKYRSLTAHLTAIAGGIRWGKWINGYYTVIGWAGDTGETYAGADWAPHLHARVAWGESLTFNGQPYGGQSVRPNRLRCFTCNNPDIAASGGGGWYTGFWHGRWMKY